MASSTRISPKTSNFGKFITRGSSTDTGLHQHCQVPHDVHLKMCKRIAQLTKVIFALNTKTDEHESILDQLKERHEEELQQMIASTREKISHFKSRFETNSELQSRIKFLEDWLYKEEQTKHQMEAEMLEIRIAAEIKEEKFKHELSEKVLELTQKFQDINKDFKQKREEFELKKTTALEELQQAQRQEIADLMKSHSEKNQEYESEMKRLQEQHEEKLKSCQNQLEYEQENHMKEVLALKECQKQEIEHLREEKNLLEQHYQLRLASLHVCHEQEMAAFKNIQHSSHEEQLKIWKDKELQLEQQWEEKVSSFQTQMKELSAKINNREHELAMCQQELQIIISQSHKKDINISSLNHRLSEAKSETTNFQCRLEETESELALVKEKCEELVTQIQEKILKLESSENRCLEQETKYNELDAEIGVLKDKIGELEKEKWSLQSAIQQQSENYSQQMRCFKQSLEKINSEKERLKEDHRQKVQRLEQQWQDEKQHLTKEQINKYEELQSQFQLEADFHQQLAEDRLQAVRQEMEMKIEDERMRLISEKQSLGDEFELVRVDLNQKLEEAEKRIKKGQQELANSLQELEKANQEKEDHSQELNNMYSQMDNSHSQLSASRMANASLQAEIAKLKSIHESHIEQIEEECREKLSQLSSDLQERWQARLDSDTNELRIKLEAEFTERKKICLDELSEKHNADIAEVHEEWQERDKLSALKIVELEQCLSQQIAMLQKERSSILDDKEQLIREMLIAGEESTEKLQELEKNYKDQLQAELESKEQEFREKDKSLQEKFDEDFKKQKEEFEELLQRQKKDSEIIRMESIKVTKESFSEKIDMLQEEAKSGQAELEELAHAQEAQITALQLELDISVQNIRQKEKDIRDSESRLKLQLEECFHELRFTKQELQADLTACKQHLKQKNQELEKMRQDNAQQMRPKSSVFRLFSLVILVCLLSLWVCNMVARFTEYMNRSDSERSIFAIL